MARPWLSIEGIARRYGDRPVFRDVWFGVERGEFVALIGHSGCGKTTILNILAGLEAPDGGTIVMDGHEVAGPALDRAVIFQSHALLPWLTAQGNVAFAVRSRHRDWARARVQEEARRVLDLVGLGDAAGRKPAELSGGMKQRVGIAQAHQVQHAPGLVLHLGLGPIAMPAAYGKCDVALCRQPGQQGMRLEDDGAVQRRAGHLLPVHDDASGVRRFQPGQDVQDGGLAAAGVADQRHELPTLHPEPHVPEHGTVAIPARDPLDAQPSPRHAATPAS